jgi:hypothetical protein
MAVPAPSGIGVRESAGTITLEVFTLAGSYAIVGSPCFNASSVAGNVEFIGYNAQFTRGSDADVSENLL